MKKNASRSIAFALIAAFAISRGSADEPLREPAAEASVPVIGGTIELGLGHLCDQKGCVDHLHKSLPAMPSIVGVRPSPGDDPRATLFVRAGQAIDLWGLAESLGEKGIAVRRIRSRDFASVAVEVELRRWKTADDDPSPSQCMTCLVRLADVIHSVSWAGEASAVDRGLRVQPPTADADIAELMRAIERSGTCPAAVWLVPAGATPPSPTAPLVARRSATPKAGGSEAHPLIQIDLDHECFTATRPLDALSDLAWVSRSGVAAGPLGDIGASRVLDGATLLVAVGDRQHAELTPLVREWRRNGQQPRRVRLDGFHDLRVQFEFAHLCGDVEYSKPPEKSKKPDGEMKHEPKKDESKEDEQDKPESKQEESKKDEPKKDEQQKEEPKKEEPKKEEKPFVPQPLRPAASSNARQAIERAVAGVEWVQKATYFEYHTKLEFNGPRRLTMSMQVTSEAVPLDELINALAQAGFPPTSVRVSRLFPGIAFGERLPADVEVTDATGAKKPLTSFRRPGRPLAVAFVSLKAARKTKYEADPKFFAQIKKTASTFSDRADFVAVSSNPEDEFTAVAELLKKAEWEVPALHDASGLARAVLNAQSTPPPHLFVFDADGRLRYAGDPHDNWEKPDEKQRDFMAEALELVLAGKWGANGAVYFQSPRCNCSSPNCKCPKCGCGPSCRCDIGH
jgi:hypothetical protein